jgi:hypothetical protein
VLPWCVLGIEGERESTAPTTPRPSRAPAPVPAARALNARHSALSAISLERRGRVPRAALAQHLGLAPAAAATGEHRNLWEIVPYAGKK